MSCQTSNPISITSPLIILPFPPVIKASDIVDKRKPCRIKSKGPNAFLIYRKAFLDQLSPLKHNFKMTEVSKLVSEYWKNETENVKNEYRKIAREVEIVLNEKRQNITTYRVVWKNSKHSVRKRKRSQIKTKERKNKSTEDIQSKSNTKSKAKVYQFVHTEFNSEPSTNNDETIVSTFDPKDSCVSSENFSNSDPNFNEFNEYNEFNTFDESVVEYDEFINYQDYQGSNNNFVFDQTSLQLQFAENSTNLNNNNINQHFIPEENEHVDWYLQNF